MVTQISQGPLVSANACRLLPVRAIEKDAKQPRHIVEISDEGEDEEIGKMAESFQTVGVLHCVLVRRKPGMKECYILVAGERRWKAAQRAKLKEIPACILETENPRTILQVQLVENLLRRNLTVLQIAAGVRQLQGMGMRQKEMAAFLHKSVPWVSKAATIAEGLTREAFQAIAVDAAKFTVDHLYQIARKAPNDQVRLIESIRTHGTTREELRVAMRESQKRRKKCPSSPRVASSLSRCTSSRKKTIRLDSGVIISVRFPHSTDLKNLQPQHVIFALQEAIRNIRQGKIQ